MAQVFFRGFRSQRGDWRLVTLLAILLLVPLCSRFLLARVGTLHTLELLAYDWHNGSLPPQAPDPRLVYVGMDDASLPFLPLPAARRFYPLPRAFHAQAVDELRRAGARVIGFDVMFTRESPAEDAIFAAALARQKAVHTPALLALRHESVLADGREEITYQHGLPAPRLRPYTVPVSITASRNLQRVRWFPLYPVDSVTGERYLQMPLGLVAAFRSQLNAAPAIGEEFHWGSVRAPLGPDGQPERLTRYAGPAGTFAPVPFHEVFNGTWKQKRGADFFRDKIVLIGRYDPLDDHHDTPWGNMAGTEILLHQTQTLLRDERLSHWSEAGNYLLKVLLCGVLVLVVWRTGMRWAVVTTLSLAVAWVLCAHMLFLRAGLWADTVEPIGALLVSLVLVTAAEARRMRLVFRRFLPSEVAERMLRSNVNERVSTAEREATIVFCDVRDFTAISESMELAAMEELLHQYFLAGEEAAARWGSEIDKFVGDEIMLTFEDKPTPLRWQKERRTLERRKRQRRSETRPGTADRRSNQRRAGASHAVRALQWALEMQDAANQINASGLAGSTGFRVGIGICSGRVRVGTVGARQRIQHTTIGDAVNTASRLQGASKELGRAIVLARSTQLQLHGEIETELIGHIAVKGKAEPLEVHAPLAAAHWKTNEGQSS